jgi:hypothetical protein
MSFNWSRSTLSDDAFSISIHVSTGLLSGKYYGQMVAKEQDLQCTKLEKYFSSPSRLLCTLMSLTNNTPSYTHVSSYMV